MSSFNGIARRAAVAALGWALLGPAAPARAEEARLAGAAAWARVVGNTVAGTTPDGPFTALFSADGAFTLVDRDGKSGGRWALKGERVCTAVDDEEECRALEVQGSSGAFIDEGGARYPFAILPGNPENL